MIYIIGSGFSGLTTAYALNKKGIKSTVISPGEKNKTKNISLIKYLLKNNGEILNNSNFLSKKINKLNKANITNCKYLLSHMDGGQSNIWGGVVGNIGEYNYNNSLIKKSEILKYKKEIINLLKIINIKYIQKKNKKINNYLLEKNYSVSKKDVSNLKRYLIKKKVIFKNNLFVKKIDLKNSILETHDIKTNDQINLPYTKIFLSCGPIETSKLILNSVQNIKKIVLKETQHFYALIKVNHKLKSRFFDAICGKYNFSCQLYSLKNIVGLFFKNYLKNLNSFNKNKYFIGQCYLNSNYSGKINISKKSSKFTIEGKPNFRFNISQFKTDIKKFNKQNKVLNIKKLFFNKIGASNHLGGSIPITKNRSIKLGVSKYGKLNNHKNIYISDSSILNDIDISPITIFSLNNILRMILSNKKI